jgi:transposase
MLTPRPSQQIFFATEPVDMRGGFDRLAGRVMQAGLDLYAGHLFVFVSKRRTHLKVLTWDGSGMVILFKRLSKGCFVLPDVPTNARTATIDPASLAALLDGLQVHGVRRSKSAVGTTPAIDAAAGA